MDGSVCVRETENHGNRQQTNRGDNFFFFFLLKVLFFMAKHRDSESCDRQREGDRVRECESENVKQNKRNKILAMNARKQAIKQ